MREARLVRTDSTPGSLSRGSFEEKCQETQLAARPLPYDHAGKMSKERPAQLRIWVECPRCGCIDKLTREFQLPINEAGTRVEKVGLPCERCATPAYMYFERTVSNIH